MATYYERNREKCIEQATLYQWAHKEHYKEYQRQYFLQNKEKLQEKARLRRLQNKPPKERKVRIPRPPKIKAPKEPKEPKKRGRPLKPEAERKSPYRKREKKIEPETYEIVIAPPEPIEEQQIIWVSDKDFICSFD